MNTTEHIIRQTAIRLISRCGFESMTLRQLANESGVNSSSLYLYYKGKSELLLSLVLSYLETLAQAWEQCRPEAASADQLLQAFVACHVRHHLLHREEAVLGHMELRSLDKSELAIVRLARQRHLAKLQRILEQGIREGTLHCDEPKLLARTIFMLLVHASAWYQANGRLSLDDVIEHYCTLVHRMVGRSQPLPLPPAPEHTTPTTRWV